MKRQIAITLLCSTVCLSATLTQGKDLNMTPGKWQMTTTATNPFMSPAPETKIECLTKEDITEDPLSDLVEEGCVMSNVKKSKNHVSADVTCDKSKNHYDFRFNGDSYSATITATVDMPAMPNMPAGPMKTTIQIDGKRLGRCD